MKNRMTIVLSLLVSLAAWGAYPTGYYSQLDGKRKADLKEAAKRCVASHVAVAYGTSTWEAFEKTDVRTVGGRLVWWDMYSNNLVDVSSGHDGLNIEHSVANSWWGKTKNDAYKDLFHLNPSDATANNRKSNYPLGVVVDATYDNGVTKVGHPASGDCYGSTWVYEPADEYKGDFARAFFYIFTVYDDISWMDSDDRNFMYDGTSYPSLRPWAYEMLLEWSRLDPVSQKEIERNEAIYKIQNNRNPFIDFPELAEYIWGDKSHLNFDSETSVWDDDPDPGDQGSGSGIATDPYDVAYVIAHADDESDVWVEGYVVGFVEGMEYMSGAVFGNETDGYDYTNTNVILGSSAAETDASRCIPVQLASDGDLRDVFGMGNNPNIYQRHVRMKGKLTRYFGRRGLKNVTDYHIYSAGVEEPLCDAMVMPEAYCIAGGVCVVGRPGTEVSVHDLSGRLASRFVMASDRQNVMLPAGIYVLTAQGGARKLIVD